MYLTRLPRLAAALAAGRDEGLHTGAQIYISCRGEVWADCGWGEIALARTLERDLVMPWLSAGKPLTVLALAQLQQTGALNWSDPVVRFLPEFDTPDKTGVTLWHLLTHTAGLTQIDTGWPAASDAEILQRICSTPRLSDWTPGTRQAYVATSSWFVLGEVLHRLTGRTAAQVIREQIFQPLGLQNSWMELSPADYEQRRDRIGTLQMTDRGSLRPHAYSSPLHLQHCSPGSSAHGPIRELGRLYETLLACYHGRDDRLLQSNTLRELVRQQTAGLMDETFRHRLDRGLGFMRNSNAYGPESVPYSFGLHAGPNLFGHCGMQSSAGFADPDHELVVAFVLNGCPGEPRHNRRARRLNTALYEDLGIA